MSSQAVVAQEDKELQIMLKLADSEGVSKFLFFSFPARCKRQLKLSCAAAQDSRGSTR